MLATARVPVEDKTSTDDVEVPGFAKANFHDLPDPAFEIAVEKLSAAGIGVYCFGSTIMNWAKTIDTPFEVTLAEVRRRISAGLGEHLRARRLDDAERRFREVLDLQPVADLVLPVEHGAVAQRPARRAPLLHGLRDRLRLVPTTAAMEHDVVAIAPQAQRDGSADAARASGNQSDLSLERFHAPRLQQRARRRAGTGGYQKR